MGVAYTILYHMQGGKNSMKAIEGQLGRESKIFSKKFKKISKKGLHFEKTRGIIIYVL